MLVSCGARVSWAGLRVTKRKEISGTRMVMCLKACLAQSEVRYLRSTNQNLSGLLARLTTASHEGRRA